MNNISFEQNYENGDFEQFSSFFFIHIYYHFQNNVLRATTKLSTTNNQLNISRQ